MQTESEFSSRQYATLVKDFSDARKVEEKEEKILSVGSPRQISSASQGNGSISHFCFTALASSMHIC